ncbi:MAG: SRPBCC family protein [Prevotellaceae bacterium]|nr:SRPBCC family protein [Prevotellaceae bacterium]
MSKYESSVHIINYPQEKVYAKLSDLSNIEKVKDRIPAEQVKDLTFDRDSVSVNVPPVGSVTLKIVERQELKCIKFEAENSPLPFNLWIQLLPVTETSCKMKVTVKADIPIFLKPMVGNKLEEGVEKIAQTLAMVPYE